MKQGYKHYVLSNTLSHIVDCRSYPEKLPLMALCECSKNNDGYDSQMAHIQKEPV